MMVLKEAGPGPSIQHAEVLYAEQNSFAQFLDENKEALERHSFLTYDLRDEEEGWKNSPTIDSIVEKTIEFGYSLNPMANTANSKTYVELQDKLGNMLQSIFLVTPVKKTDLLKPIFANLCLDSVVLHPKALL